MSKIVSIGTAVPEYRHRQEDILEFMRRAYALNDASYRKLKYLFRHGGVETRYLAVPDYSLPAAQWEFFTPAEDLWPLPDMEKRMDWFRKLAAPLSLQAVRACLKECAGKNITHLITVSCTGMSAPGLDLEMLDLLELPVTTFRTSVNFMGCYAAIHALKMADAFCKSDNSANVLIVCTELCSLHFQKEISPDNFTSSLLFADGSAAVLVSGDPATEGLSIDHFYSSVSKKGKQDMAWNLCSQGFRMTLSSYIPDLVESDFDELVENALAAADVEIENITHWCIHPGGKKILEAVHKSLGFTNGQLQHSYDILKDYGNMSSPTVLFVLDHIMNSLKKDGNNKIFGAAFGPGLTMETFLLSSGN